MIYTCSNNLGFLSSRIPVLISRISDMDMEMARILGFGKSIEHRLSEKSCFLLLLHCRDPTI